MTSEALRSTSSITLSGGHGIPPRFSVPTATSPMHGTSPGQRSSFAIHELLGLGRQETPKTRELIPSRPLISPLIAAAAAAGHPAIASMASCLPALHSPTASFYLAAAKASVSYDHAALAALAMHSNLVQHAARSPPGLTPVSDSRTGK